MRTMFDSTTVSSLPGDGDLYAAYIDGNFANYDAVQRLAGNRPVVKIAVREATNDGDVFDTEAGNPPPDAAARWVEKRRGQGAWWAGVYMARSRFGAVQVALSNVGIDPATVPFWVADATCQPHLLPGSVATQWWIPPACGNSRGNLDISVVADFWPGIDSGAPPAPPANRTGEVGMFCVDRDTGTIWHVAPGGVIRETDLEVVKRKLFVGVANAGEMNPLEIIKWAMDFGAWDFDNNDFKYYAHSSDGP